MKKLSNLLKFLILVLFFVSIDQVVKYLVVSKMTLFQKINVIGEFFSISYVTNTGAAFGLMKGCNNFFIGLSFIFILLVLFYLFLKKEINTISLLALSLITAGAVGNLIDRIFRGYVVDFFDVKYFSVFNIADIMINLGVIMMILILFLNQNKSS